MPLIVHSTDSMQYKIISSDIVTVIIEELGGNYAM